MRDRWEAGGGGWLKGEKRNQEARDRREGMLKKKTVKWWENDRLRGAHRGKQKAKIHKTTRRHMKIGKGERNRERERDRARELHAIRITSSIPQFGYVIFVAQLIEARSMHILNFNTKDACELMGGQQNNQHNYAINCCFAIEQDAWVTCKQLLIIAMETNACFRVKGREAVISLSSLKLLSPHWNCNLYYNPVSGSYKHKLKFNKLG